MTEDTKKEAEEIREEDLDQAQGGGMIARDHRRSQSLTVDARFSADIVGQTPPLDVSFEIVGETFVGAPSFDITTKKTR